MTILGVCLLISLGTWQLYRLQWKTHLIETFQSRLSQAPQDGQYLLSAKIALNDFTPIYITGTVLQEFQLKLQGRSHNGQIGYHLIQALIMPNDMIVLVDRGWVPLMQNHGVEKHVGVTLKGYIRHRSDRNFMTPSNDYGQREIYSLDPLDVAHHFKLPNVAPFYMVETGAVIKDHYPVPAQPVLHLRNNHLQYAIIWYTLALALIVIYLLFQGQIRKTISEK